MLNALQLDLEEKITAKSLAILLTERAPEASAEDIKELAALLVPFLRSIPQALSVAIRMSKKQECGRTVAFATGQVLTYLLDDNDLLPEEDFGIVGLLDDAYLAHIFAKTLARIYPQANTSRAGYRPPDRSTFSVVRSLLPAGVADALERTSDNLLHVASSLFGSAKGIEGTPLQPAPVLRVSEALQAIYTARV